MTLAVSTGIAVLSLIGLAIGLALLLVVLALFNRILRPVNEIDHYAEDILDGGLGIARNVDGVDELGRTRKLATAVPGLAGSYLNIVKRKL
jgi:methyl-accepting chemotaxis protein